MARTLRAHVWDERYSWSRPKYNIVMRCAALVRIMHHCESQSVIIRFCSNGWHWTDSTVSREGPSAPLPLPHYPIPLSTTVLLHPPLSYYPCHSSFSYPSLYSIILTPALRFHTFILEMQQGIRRSALKLLQMTPTKPEHKSLSCAGDRQK